MTSANTDATEIERGKPPANVALSMSTGTSVLVERHYRGPRRDRLIRLSVMVRSQHEDGTKILLVEVSLKALAVRTGVVKEASRSQSNPLLSILLVGVSRKALAVRMRIALCLPISVKSVIDMNFHVE